MPLPKNLVAERLQNVVKWLEPLNSQAKLREVRGRRQPETCDWLPSHRLFVSWCESTGSFLWLNGIRECSNAHLRPITPS